MKNQVLAIIVSLSLAVAVTGAQPDINPPPQRLFEWQIIEYYGKNSWDLLPWYYQWGVDAGVALGCGFIGAGVGTLTGGMGAFLTGYACDQGIMA